MKKISFILGGWSVNIGNAFFQLGGLHVLSRVLPDSKFTIIGEQPGYPSYWNPKGGNPRNYFDMASSVKSDYLVLMGPIFRPETLKIWAEALDKTLSSETRLILLGVSAMSFEEQHLREYRSFLTKYRPYIFVSRDSESFDLLGDCAEFAYDGIDFGFFISDYYSAGGLDLPPFVALNFDKIPEPNFQIIEKSDISVYNDQLKYFFEFNGETWIAQQDIIREKLARRSRYLMFLEGVLFPGNQATCIGPYLIVRTDHRPHPTFAKKTFRSPNVLVNDTPYPYFEVYANADLTLSNRLHACVAALTYGKPAMLFSSSPRIKLLERLGLGDITRQPVILDENLIRYEKECVLSFLSKTLL